jgi:signal transduction histidine kinase
MTLPLAYAVADLAVGIAFLLGGLLVWWRERTRLPAALLALTGTTWFLGNLGGLPGAAGTLAAAGAYLHRGLLLHLGLTLPSGRPRSSSVTTAVSLGYLVAAVAVLARNDFVTLAVAVGLVAMVGYQSRLRIDAWPVGGLAAALAGPALARLLLPTSASGGALLWYDGCLVVLAVVLTGRLLHSRRADVADLVVGLSVAPSQGLRDALARAVGDPTLHVAYVADDGFVDARGEPTQLDTDDDRVVTPLSRDGEVFGFISHDPEVLADPVLVDAVETAAALTSANARLQADVAHQSARVRASRRRIVTAALEERRRLETELRLGPGARLQRVSSLLDAVSPSDVPEGLVDQARNQAARAACDLRDLAQGLHPLALRAAGLGGAIVELAASAPLPVAVEIEGHEVPVDVAETAYYVCAEGLTNVARHARARSASIRLSRESDRLQVIVADDGAGGADPNGSGLSGLADRVVALGGELTVASDSAGTRLLARLPTSC